MTVCGVFLKIQNTKGIKRCDEILENCFNSTTYSVEYDYLPVIMCVICRELITAYG